MKTTPPIFVILIISFLSNLVQSREPDRVLSPWPEMAPGETTANAGEILPRRPRENPPAIRIAKITKPLLEFYEPPVERRSGVSVLILPGGGYNYVVTDKEGSESADWLNKLGITAIVLRYRTKNGGSDHWIRPVQDTHRSIRFLRSMSHKLNLNPDQIGLMGFSAGGQAAAIAATNLASAPYSTVDSVDKLSPEPDFLMLIYPWQLVDETQSFMKPIRIEKNCPPTFLVHTHDDRSTSMGSILFYSALKKLNIQGELHVYQTGGHGYGTRPVAGSVVHTWPTRAADWLRISGIVE